MKLNPLRLATRLDRGRHQSRGQALVELAIILPVMLFLLMGALDLGRVFYANIAVTNAAKEGALFASGGGSSPASAAVAEARGGFVTVTSGNVTTAYSDTTNKCSATAALGATVSVTVKAPFQAVTPFVGALLGGGNVMLASTATARCAVFPAVALNPPSSTDCTVPSLIGQPDSTAASAWSAAGFTGGITRVPATTGWAVVAQSPAGDASVACTSSLTLYKVAPSNCTVPAIGKNWYFANYSSAWAAAGFTGTLTDSTGGHKVGSVSPAVGSTQACTTAGTAN
jgi:Flp pilus assembly protein TadG